MLPDPSAYSDWREYASALSQALTNMGLANLAVPVQSSQQPAQPSPATSITMPDGYRMVWLSQAESDLFLGNPMFDPPVADDLFQIDSGQIAEAAIKLANMGEDAVGELQVIDAAIKTAAIGEATILAALIADAQILTAKIDDLAVNTAKIANLAVNSAKIANLSVGVAHIVDAAITNAKIGNEISSYSWDGVNGWRIDKEGNIQGTSITILNPDGSVAFAAGKLVDLGTEVTGLLDLATYVTGQLQGFEYINGQLTADNISTYIAGAAIGTALIADAAIVNALIADATILTAKIGAAQITEALIGTAAIGTAAIQDLAVGNAQIADLAVTSAKILELTFSRLTAGTLDAEIDVGTGLIKMTVGSSQLILGKGFGTTGQFFLWFGPALALNQCSESNAVIYFKTNGSAYFGGSLSAGIIRNAVGTTATAANAEVTNGPFGSNGGTRNLVLSYDFGRKRIVTSGTNTATGTPSATIRLYRVVSNVETEIAVLNVSGSTMVDGTNPSPTEPGTAEEIMGGSTTFADNSGGLTATYRARITARTLSTFNGGTTTADTITQQVTIISTEE